MPNWIIVSFWIVAFLGVLRHMIFICTYNLLSVWKQIFCVSTSEAEYELAPRIRVAGVLITGGDIDGTNKG